MYVNAAEPGGACPGPCWCSMYASLALFPNHHSLLILPRPSDRNPTEKTSRPEETADTLGFGPSSINVTIPSIGSGADRIVGAIRFRSAPRRCGLCCHDMTPGHGGIRLQGDRNCELAFVNLLR